MDWNDALDLDFSNMPRYVDKGAVRRKKASQATKQNRVIIRSLRNKGIEIDYKNSLNLQLVEILTTRKAFQIGFQYRNGAKHDYYYGSPKVFDTHIVTIVGYVIKNNGSVPCRYLKATYGENEISYTEAFINPGEQVIITRHELYGLRLFNGAKISCANGNNCIIITSGRGKKFRPFIRGINCNLRKAVEMQKSIDDDSDIQKILPEYQEKFSWLANRHFFKQNRSRR